MVSTGSAERQRRNKSPYWGLIGGGAVLLFVGILALGSSNIMRAKAEQAKAQQATEQCAADPNKKSCGDVIAVRAVVASEQAIRVGIWQTAFSFLGLVGLAGTVGFAGMAWVAARDSADADNENLRVTREAFQHDRKVSEADQRPWIAQKLIVRKVIIGSGLVKVEGTIRCTNLGRTVAKICSGGEQELFGATTSGKTIDEWHDSTSLWSGWSYILPGQETEAELFSFFIWDGDYPDPSSAVLRITIASRYSGIETGDYLTSDSFWITKRGKRDPNMREGFYPHDAQDFLPDQLHIDPVHQLGRVR